MLKHFFQINFLLITISCHHCLIIQLGSVNHTHTFDKQICESLLTNCSCHYSFYVYSINCQKMTDLSNFSRIHETGDAFNINNYFLILFKDIKHLPTGSLSGLNVRYLDLDGEDVTVDEDVFTGMRFLEEFRVEKSSIEVIPDFRTVSSSIWKIKIDSSRLTSLEGKNLQDLPLMRSLSFSNNLIRFIDPDVFKGTEGKLMYLYLSRNLLTSIPPKLLDPMQKLSVIDISNNNLQHVDNLFSITLPGMIDLGFNNITDIDSILHFKTDKIMRFTLSGNPIEKLSDNGFLRRMPNVKELYLAHCKLQEYDAEQFLSTDSLEVLDLRFNLIEVLHKPPPSLSHEEHSQDEGKFHWRNKLRQLLFDGNEIEYLTDEDLKNVNPMHHLHIKENKIRRIDTNTFQPSKDALQILDLSSNLIQSLNGSVRYLPYLRMLNLSYNLIQSFTTDEFMGLRNLVDLYLQYNQLKILGQLQLPAKLSSMHLAGNPLQCDCRQQPLMLRVNASSILSTGTELCLRSEFVNTLHCPELCSCSCTYVGEFSFMSVDCSSKNLFILPEVFKTNSIIMEDNSTVISDDQRPFVIDQNIYPFLHLEDHVLGINLENNSLESLEGIKLHPDLLQLYLANNNLRRLPEFIFHNLQNLKQVSLAGNPWACDCNTIKFKKWLTSNYVIIQDLNDTRCGKSEKGESNLDGKVLWTLSELDMCPTNDILFLSASIGFLELENKAPDVRLCIHYRDFLAGEFIHNNIKYAVENSKKTIIFLSRSFLDSEWCLMEFQAAHEQTLKDKFQRIILVKIGDLPKEIDRRIKVYLDSTTYLSWGESYFWKKLLFILPTSSSEENPVSRNTSVAKTAKDISFPDLSKYIVESSHKSHQSQTIL